MSTSRNFPTLAAEEAAELIPHGALVGVSGFTPAGSPKAVPRALARRARALHQEGREFQVRLVSGASTGPSCDDELGAADALSWRAPYLTSAPLRKQANDGSLDFVDMHLSHVSQMILGGFLGKVDVAIVEATEITPDGQVYLTTGIGNSPALLQVAEKVIIERNAYHSPRLRELADVILLPPPPLRRALPIHDVLDRVGWHHATVDPSRVVGVVETNEPDGGRAFAPPDATSQRIAEHVARFLLDELAVGRIPPKFLPLQSGVGNVGNAVLGNLGARDDFPKFKVFTEVLQDTALDLIASGKITAASTCSLSISDDRMRFFYENFNDFAEKVVLRPQEISNHPALARQLGVIASNTAIEIDVYGHANSTHFFGTQVMNGIGGSGDFERNAYLSIFMCPSVAKGGRISTIVPMCSHVDHSEHSVQVIVTEQGLADIRGLAPMDRARLVIDRCAHPAYRDYLHRYLESAPPGHIRHDLRRCFELHTNFLERGMMLPDLDLKEIGE
ncbi:MAG: succinate CoA transferase [Isosphaeraceae bacterium]